MEPITKTGMERMVYIEPLVSLDMGQYTKADSPQSGPSQMATNYPIEVPESTWVYRVELVLHNDDGTIHDWALVKVASWQWGEPCIDDQLRDWVIQYMPEWLIVDARLATKSELSKNYADTDEEF